MDRIHNFGGMAEKLDRRTLQSPIASLDRDMQSMWDAKRQLESLEERMASAVAYLHRQLLDLQNSQSGGIAKMPADVDARLVALEQQQEHNKNRLAAVADGTNALSKEQHVRLIAFSEMVLNSFSPWA